MSPSPTMPTVEETTPDLFHSSTSSSSSSNTSSSNTSSQARSNQPRGIHIPRRRLPRLCARRRLFSTTAGAKTTPLPSRLPPDPHPGPRVSRTPPCPLSSRIERACPEAQIPARPPRQTTRLHLSRPALVHLPISSHTATSIPPHQIYTSSLPALGMG